MDCSVSPLGHSKVFDRALGWLVAIVLAPLLPGPPLLLWARAASQLQQRARAALLFQQWAGASARRAAASLLVRLPREKPGALPAVPELLGTVVAGSKSTAQEAQDAPLAVAAAGQNAESLLLIATALGGTHAFRGVADRPQGAQGSGAAAAAADRKGRASAAAAAPEGEAAEDAEAAGAKQRCEEPLLKSWGDCFLEREMNARCHGLGLARRGAPWACRPAADGAGDGSAAPAAATPEDAARDLFVLAATCVFFCIWTPATTAILQLFSCVVVEPHPELNPIPSSFTGRWLLQDMGERCYEGAHLQFLLGVGIPGLAFVVLGGPLFLAHVVVSQSEQLGAWEVARRLGFVYSGARLPRSPRPVELRRSSLLLSSQHSVWPPKRAGADACGAPPRPTLPLSCAAGYVRDVPWWDVAIYLRKFAIAASTVFLFGTSSEAVTLQLLAVAIILMISLYYQARAGARPPLPLLGPRGTVASSHSPVTSDEVCGTRLCFLPPPQALYVPYVHSELSRLEEIAIYGAFNICVGELVIFAGQAPPGASVVLQIGSLAINGATFVIFAGGLLHETQRVAALRALRNPNGDGTVRPGPMHPPGGQAPCDPLPGVCGWPAKSLLKRSPAARRSATRTCGPTWSSACGPPSPRGEASARRSPGGCCSDTCTSLTCGSTGARRARPRARRRARGCGSSCPRRWQRPTRASGCGGPRRSSRGRPTALCGRLTPPTSPCTRCGGPGEATPRGAAFLTQTSRLSHPAN